MIVEYSTVEIPGTDGLAATITLNRPAELNAMSWEMIGACDAAVSQAADDEAVRVVFVTGSGRAFSAGGDLKSYLELQRDPLLLRFGRQLFGPGLHGGGRSRSDGVSHAVRRDLVWFVHKPRPSQYMADGNCHASPQGLLRFSYSLWCFVLV